MREDSMQGDAFSTRNHGGSLSDSLREYTEEQPVDDDADLDDVLGLRETTPVDRGLVPQDRNLWHLLATEQLSSGPNRRIQYDAKYDDPAASL